MMRVRSLVTVIGATCLALLMAGAVSSASSAGTSASGYGSAAGSTRLVIRHNSVGCHDWALGGGDFRVAQTLVIPQGQSFSVENRDNGGHELVQTSGPAGAEMTSVADGAPTSGEILSLRPGVQVTLGTAGTYTFKTVERGELAYYDESDLSRMFGFAKLASSGPVNVLTLTVRVAPDHNELLGPGAVAVW